MKQTCLEYIYQKKKKTKKPNISYILCNICQNFHKLTLQPHERAKLSLALTLNSQLSTCLSVCEHIHIGHVICKLRLQQLTGVVAAKCCTLLGGHHHYPWLRISLARF